MKDLKKKQRIAYALTIVTLANIWACFIFDVQNAREHYAKGSFAMLTIILIGLSIVQWARYNKAYINYRIAEDKLNNNKV